MAVIPQIRLWLKNSGARKKSVLGTIGVLVCALVAYGAFVIVSNDDDDKAGATASGGSPTASDVGVTPTTIKVGFSQLSFATSKQAGLAPDVRSDTKKVIEAYVDAINTQGPAALGLPGTSPGVLGRKLVADIKKVDPLDPSDMQAKCLQFTETDKVFAVLDVTALAIVRQCITTQHHTPFITSTAFDAKSQLAGYPYDITIGQNANRIMKNLVRSAKDAGLFDTAKGFKKLGILEQGDESIFHGSDGLLSFLKEAEVPSSAITEFAMSGDAAQQNAQIKQAVLKFKQEGVNLVLPLAWYGAVATFLADAEAQQWRPQYYASDYLNITHDVSAKTFIPDQWDRTRAATEMTSGELNAGQSPNPAADHCSKILVAHKLPALKNYDDTDVEAAALCDALKVFVAAMEKQGTNPTRADLAPALGTVGALSLATRDKSVYDRAKKVSGGDTLSTIEWRRDCACWHQVAPPRPAYG